MKDHFLTNLLQKKKKKKLIESIYLEARNHDKDLSANLSFKFIPCEVLNLRVKKQCQ